MKIGDSECGVGQRCLVIGEVGQAHDGSLGTAHAFIDAIADAGADAVKFQTHIAEAESTPAEPWRVKFSYQDESRFDYWKRMEFSPQQWAGLKQHADERGITFLSSPFSVEAVDVLQEIGMPAWKIASGELQSKPMLDRIAQTGMPVLISSGMATWSELDSIVDDFRSSDCDIAVFQCTSSYPCPPEKVGLGLLKELSQRYHCPVGLSDHSGTVFAGLAAAAIGANLLEVHVTLSREMFGPDVCVSLTTAELKLLVDGVRFIGRAMSSPYDKDAVAGEMASMRKAFNKGVVARADLPIGTVLDTRHVTVKKPALGIPAQDIDTVIGRKLVREVRINEPLTECMLQPP